MSEQDALEGQAESLRAAEALGRSDSLQKLFDFLLERSRAGAAPKETEVAAAVFGRGVGFDVSQDASVRVAVHRLRRKLDDYYAGPGKDAQVRLSIPKGGYRLVAEPLTPDPSPLRKPLVAVARGRAWMVLAAAVLVLNALAWGAFWWLHDPGDGLAKVRRTAPWSALLADKRPILVVTGDYYIFGDRDEEKGVDRLVREYAINSHDDLDAYLMQHPEQASRYFDLDLHYLPAASAFAVQRIAPVLAPTAKDRDRIRVVLASDLTPEMLKSSDIVYVGYLSGLGLLRDPVFAGSRFSVGETYDELVDSVSGKHFESQEGGPSSPDEKLRDIGYISSFTGPNGNHILVIAGARDIAVMQMAETATQGAALKALIGRAHGADAFEAIYDVEGIRRSNLGGHLLLASPLKTDRIWSPQTARPQFPAG